MASEHWPAGGDTRPLLVAVSVIVAFVANTAGLLAGITSVIPHIFYLPIVLAAYYYPRRGTVFSFALGLGYLVGTLPFISGEVGLVVAAIARVVVFVAIGATVALLSMRLREQERRYRGVFDNSEAGIFIVAPGDGGPHIEEANYVGAALLGSTAKNLIGEPITRFLDDPGVWGDLQVKVRSDKAVYGYETALRRPDGTVVQVIVSGGRLPDGRVILTLVDITDRKSAEDALLQANTKLNMMGRLTRNDLMSAVSALLRRINRGMSEFDDHTIRRYLEELQEDARFVQRRAEITRDYQNLGLRPSGWQPLQDVVREVTSCLLLPGVSVRPWVERLEVFADPMLDQVYSNLIENSIRHGKTVSEVVITYQIQDGGLVIYVEDDGVGIPEAEKEKIFEYTADGEGGLGLFFVREILSITGMTIRETGKPGEGARFEIHVPPDGYRIV
ncbi:MAG: PAS domain-containing sensor histidine kinase [Methanoculleus sp.]